MKATQAEAQVLSREQARWMYRKMVEIRKFEDAVHLLFGQGKLPGFVHLYAGEEAIAVGVGAHLNQQDSITSTHRGHGHCIAKECDLNGMMAELYGKATGLCKGKGGSMHIADLDKGMLGANGIVGGGFPLACGAALTAKLKKSGAVSVCFFGDGANNQGTFHEGLNLAAIWKLPVVFVAENNGYAEATPFTYASSCTRIADRASGYNMPGVVVDGKDVLAVYRAAGEAIARARRGEGPTLIECITYRNYGHFEGDAQKYKTEEEKAEHLNERDAIALFRNHLLATQTLTADEINGIERDVDAAVQAAIRFAEESPYPDASELLTDVYVSY
ncbi:MULTISPECIES: thiamine pyrophosphate-dependent dehydrogenase E1 component subunit alpha [Brevibacillus]|jgi:acetoin:2,6-dichlorophenolindophenol oxidoreductase subunit alpha|uniref:Pyruvate dehydrogenase (Acetyl-transferring) E1 component subunit alpha n=1 Tax=Brevibacillus aydinogluensis TaxID=927786 RepID=A0AA48M4V9_9BACL|nr:MULTISPECIES: thiamine pyrophosphate-dependent dehydrogenase E1 component subunit alpha [Brevibacillus]MDT3415759.1 pyruvate dehydrogenase E1 component alpha subunit [Brevibacillus aydinogluensis]NNV03837.1 thiamine pyrophosphate-dependent dehydrogenase E1 component subunit alpha [Brevibacillus sp. MCWH]REK63765.1 MAG: pyruvate dehydrogenase (acetyl-transferring) E1 component subunit alpha [Brevibacillus sp.]CAJ1001323.1 Pyruvate dehydrogenase (Acetyl-transferring) E1 component subunit alpha